MLSQRNERHDWFSMSQTGQASGLLLRFDSVTYWAGRNCSARVHFISRTVPSPLVNTIVTTDWRRRLRMPSFVIPSIIQPPCVRVCMKYTRFSSICQCPLSAYISITYVEGFSPSWTNSRDSNPFPFLWCCPHGVQVPLCSLSQQNSWWVESQL